MKTVIFSDTICTINTGKYLDSKQNYILLHDVETGEPVCRASVSLPATKIKDNEVFIKDYSENEGILKALSDAGIVKDTGKFIISGYVDINICELLI